METRIYEKLLQLMDIAAALCQTQGQEKLVGCIDGYIEVAAIDSKLRSWYADLPADIKRTPQNIANAPAPFFLLQ